MTQMVEMPVEEARKHYGDKLVLVSLGAIKRKDGTYPVIHDGTHGVGVNSAMKMRDQVRSKTASDVHSGEGPATCPGRLHGRRQPCPSTREGGRRGGFGASGLSRWCGAHGRQQRFLLLEQACGWLGQVGAVLVGQD